MFIYITTQELTQLFILTQEESFSKIREKSEYSTTSMKKIEKMK
jgi:hypothetical protein